jgi:hypothetical protein
MQKLFKTIVLTAALSCGIAASARAAALPTTFVQSISVQLTVTTPGAVSANHLNSTAVNTTITAPAVIQSIGKALGKTFSSSAALFYVAPINWYPNVTTNHGKLSTNYFGYPALGGVQIRDGTNKVDISSLFQITTINNISVSSYTQTAPGVYSTYTSYSVRGVTVTNSQLSFTGQGLVTTPLVNVAVKGANAVVVGYNNLWTSFCGVTSTGVLQGKIQAVFAKLE